MPGRLGQMESSARGHRPAGNRPLFGITPGSTHGCRPYEPIGARIDLAEVNVGLGCPIDVIPGSADYSKGYVDLFSARVRLTQFADWVVADGMELHSGCPHTTRSAGGGGGRGTGRTLHRCHKAQGTDTEFDSVSSTVRLSRAFCGQSVVLGSFVTRYFTPFRLPCSFFCKAGLFL